MKSHFRDPIREMLVKSKATTALNEDDLPLPTTTTTMTTTGFRHLPSRPNFADEGDDRDARSIVRGYLHRTDFFEQWRGRSCCQDCRCTFWWASIYGQLSRIGTDLDEDVVAFHARPREEQEQLLQAWKSADETWVRHNGTQVRLCRTGLDRIFGLDAPNEAPAVRGESNDEMQEPDFYPDTVKSTVLNQGDGSSAPEETSETSGNHDGASTSGHDISSNVPNLQELTSTTGTQLSPDCNAIGGDTNSGMEGHSVVVEEPGLNPFWLARGPYQFRKDQDFNLEASQPLFQKLSSLLEEGYAGGDQKEAVLWKNLKAYFDMILSTKRFWKSDWIKGKEVGFFLEELQPSQLIVLCLNPHGFPRGEQPDFRLLCRDLRLDEAVREAVREWNLMESFPVISSEKSSFLVMNPKKVLKSVVFVARVFMATKMIFKTNTPDRALLGLTELVLQQIETAAQGKQEKMKVGEHDQNGRGKRKFLPNRREDGTPQAPTKKPRGRPPKHPKVFAAGSVMKKKISESPAKGPRWSSPKESTVASLSGDESSQSWDQPKRKGRPPKNARKEACDSDDEASIFGAFPKRSLLPSHKGTPGKLRRLPREVHAKHNPELQEKFNSPARPSNRPAQSQSPAAYIGAEVDKETHAKAPSHVTMGAEGNLLGQRASPLTTRPMELQRRGSVAQHSDEAGQDHNPGSQLTVPRRSSTTDAECPHPVIPILSPDGQPGHLLLADAAAANDSVYPQSAPLTIITDMLERNREAVKRNKKAVDCCRAQLKNHKAEGKSLQAQGADLERLLGALEKEQVTKEADRLSMKNTVKELAALLEKP